MRGTVVQAPLPGGFEADSTPVRAPGAAGTADLGLLCTADFKISTGASGMCKEITHFAAPAYVVELFRSMPLPQML